MGEKSLINQGKLIGVWKDGVLKLKTRDKEKANYVAREWMNERHQVWLAPVGSFVTV